MPRRWRLVAAMAAALACASVAASPTMHHSVTAVDAASSVGVEVCRDWGKDACAASSPTGVLNPGEDALTKYGWTDVDGVYVEPGQRLTAKWAMLTFDVTTPGWVKLPGTNAGTWTLRANDLPESQDVRPVN